MKKLWGKARMLPIPCILLSAALLLLSKVSYAIDLFSPHSMGGKIGADLAKVTCFKECENRPVQANAGSNLPPPDGQLDPLCGAYKLTMADMTCDTASVAMGIAVLAACTPACLNPILYPAPYCTIASRASDALTVANFIVLSSTAAAFQQDIHGEFFGSDDGLGSHSNAAASSLAVTGVVFDRLTDPAMMAKLGLKAPTGKMMQYLLPCLSVALTAASVSATTMDMSINDDASQKANCKTIKEYDSAHPPALIKPDKSGSDHAIF